MPPSLQYATMNQALRAFLAALLCICCDPVLAGAAQASAPNNFHVQFRSAVLSQFCGKDMFVDAYVLLPDSYYREPQRRYPTFYWIPDFNGVDDVSSEALASWQAAVQAAHQEFIVVHLGTKLNGGHHEFADSANNGPWGTALTTEFIPQTEEHFRALSSVQARFVGGISSGGWSALWLQTTYPDFFGAAWVISPDPVDFRDFIGPDLTRSPPQNFYTDDAGHPYELDGRRLSRFVNEKGWRTAQLDSFEAVFSPRGSDGKPEPLFDRRTGVIDPVVAQYWETHYDIDRILRENWATLGPKLRGKLHVVVGTRDQYHLDRPVKLLRAELQALGSDAQVDFADGLTHDTIVDWNGNLLRSIISEAAKTFERTSH
jgi:hypothetical protein